MTSDNALTKRNLISRLNKKEIFFLGYFMGIGTILGLFGIAILALLTKLLILSIGGIN